MFEGAMVKLQDARTALDRLRASVKPPQVTNIRIISGPPGLRGDPVGIDDPVAFSETFSSCVAQIRSVGDAVLKNRLASKINGFRDWRARKTDECKNDNLLKFINDRRNEDLHNAVRRLSFTMHACAFSNENARAPSPGASFWMDGTGPYWIEYQGTPSERRIPYEPREGYVFTVAIITPPTTHRGKPLASSDPVTVCTLAEQYYAELLSEARSKFGR